MSRVRYMDVPSGAAARCENLRVKVMGDDGRTFFSEDSLPEFPLFQVD